MKLIYRTLCLVLGALLGAGCDNSTEPDEYGMPVPEYGVPTGTARVSGWVRDLQDEPIVGIEVEFQGGWRDTTDVLGRWSIDRQGVYLPCAHGNGPCQVTASDIDGADHGAFASRTVGLEMVNTEPGAGGYDDGVWEDHDVEIILPNAPEPEKDTP